MIKIKLLTTVILFTILVTISDAKNISLDEAKSIAIDLISKKTGKKISIENKLFSSSSTTKKSSFDLLDKDKEYHIIQLKPKGWAIISSDDRVKPIIGYSLKSQLDETKPLPPAFISWMHQVNNQIKKVKKSKVLSSRNTPALSKSKGKDKGLLLKTSYTIVGPLLSTEWGQDSFYNDLCPMDGGNKSLVGCVATAMSQIMRYHSWPSTGSGISSYNHRLGTLTANHSDTNYNWSNMSQNDKAIISYHVGVSVSMDYSSNGSGAYSSEAVRAFRYNFKYNVSELTSKSSMDSDGWHNRMKSNIDNSQPIYYAGNNSSGNDGHAFVCDGYKYGSDDSKEYHFNWGWDGYANGYFTIENLNPANSNYNDVQEAIFDIKPDLSAVDSDSDGIPDSVEIDNGLNKNDATDANNDIDNDGYSNLDEYNAGSDISDDNSVPVNGCRNFITLDYNTTSEWDDSCSSRNKSGSYATYYSFSIDRKKEIRIKLNSQIDTYLFLLDGASVNSKVITDNDDYIDDSTNSAINMVLGVGTYTIEATTYSSDKKGEFEIFINMDSDRDGVLDNQDAFPNDPTETKDSDGDGVGDNTDAFPSDATETIDTDGDGIGNNTDTDDDGDGIDDDTEINLGLNPVDASDVNNPIDCRIIGLLNYQGETFVKISKCIEPSSGNLDFEPMLEEAKCDSVNLRLNQGTTDCYEANKVTLKLLPTRVSCNPDTHYIVQSTQECVER